MRLLSIAFTLLFAVTWFACGSETAEATEDISAEAVEAAADTPVGTRTPDAVVEATGLKIGDTAPDFNLEGIDGEMHSLASVKDANGNAPKGYIVTFTCNTCPYAQGYEERLAALHDKMSPLGYPIVAIQPNDTEIKPDDDLDAMRARAEEKNFNFVYVIDAEQEIYPQYGASKTPEIYLLDADRVLHYHGAVDDSPQDPGAVTVNYVENAIQALEAGQTPDPQEVKAIGCTIKAKRS
jgi:peroxiredoxin